jgi:hypothetical protein
MVIVNRESSERPIKGSFDIICSVMRSEAIRISCAVWGRNNISLRSGERHIVWAG